MDLCEYEIEETEDGVGTGVKNTLLSDAVWSIGLVESVPGRTGFVVKKTHGPVWM
jgi:hypothetical protein